MTPEQRELVDTFFAECKRPDVFDRYQLSEAEWDAFVAMRDERVRYENLRAYILAELVYAVQNGGLTDTGCVMVAMHIKETYK